MSHLHKGRKRYIPVIHVTGLIIPGIVPREPLIHHESRNRDTLLSSSDICPVITILILEFSISNLLRLETLRKNLKNIVNTYKNTTLARNGPETSLDVQLGPLPH